jgi:TetR/AcrR family transcriptional regulator
VARQSSSDRKQEILETLARLLEQTQGKHITTAHLAREVGVSEAALYRHFPGKAQMFEALIEFIEETIFPRITRILEDSREADARVYAIVTLVLGFADRNPGISRLLHGDVLVGETEQLQKRIGQFFDRLDTQLKQILREAKLHSGSAQSPTESARLLMAFVEGRLAQFVRSGFREPMLTGWDDQWSILRSAIFE